MLLSFENRTIIASHSFISPRFHHSRGFHSILILAFILVYSLGSGRIHSSLSSISSNTVFFSINGQTDYISLYFYYSMLYFCYRSCTRIQSFKLLLQIHFSLHPISLQFDLILPALVMLELRTHQPSFLSILPSIELITDIDSRVFTLVI